MIVPLSGGRCGEYVAQLPSAVSHESIVPDGMRPSAAHTQLCV